MPSAKQVFRYGWSTYLMGVVFPAAWCWMVRHLYVEKGSSALVVLLTILSVLLVWDLFGHPDSFVVEGGQITARWLWGAGVAVFRSVLDAVRSRADVQEVLIEVSEVEPGDESMWPFSERVYVLTTASSAQVSAWLKQLEPSEVAEGWFQGAPPAAPALSPGFRPIAAWWD